MKAKRPALKEANTVRITLGWPVAIDMSCTCHIEDRDFGDRTWGRLPLFGPSYPLWHSDEDSELGDKLLRRGNRQDDIIC